MVPLTRLVERASQATLMIVVSHAVPLVDAITEAGAQQTMLFKDRGGTHIDGAARGDHAVF